MDAHRGSTAWQIHTHWRSKDARPSAISHLWSGSMTTGTPNRPNTRSTGAFVASAKMYVPGGGQSNSRRATESGAMEPEVRSPPSGPAPKTVRTWGFPSQFCTLRRTVLPDSAMTVRGGK